MSERGQHLRRRIAEEIRARGSISFERFMERALYEPGLGYYTAGDAQAGPGVDFRTSPLVGPVFARLLASQIEECWRRLGEPAQFVIAEFGAGSRALARGILEALERAGACPRAGRYLAVDLAAPPSDPPSSARPASPVAGPVGTPSCKVEPRPGRSAVAPDFQAPAAASEEEALEALGGEAALVLSNEFVDALPARRFVIRAGRPLEIRAALGGTPTEPADEIRFAEVEAEVRDPEVLAVLRDLPRLPEGFQFELNLRARAWMERVARSLRRGFVLTLDYGYRRAERFRPERAAGTMLGYHRHRIEHDLCARAGEQDLTSHADFDDLIDSGRRAGLELVGITDQMRFLTALAVPLGLLEGEPSSSDAWRERLAFKELIRPGGMGTTFQVLVQAKGMTVNPPLRGLVDPFAS